MMIKNIFKRIIKDIDKGIVEMYTIDKLLGHRINHCTLEIEYLIEPEQKIYILCMDNLNI